MNYRKILILLIAITALLIPSFGQAETDPEAEYTLMIYMNGSTLESGYDYAKKEFRGYATKDLAEMIEGYIPDTPINIVVETIGTKRWNNNYISNEETQRFLLTDSGFELISSLPQQNVGYKKGLSDYIVWAKRNYPAQNYGLILWNHGGGPVGGFGLDENFGGDILHIEELENALATAKANSNIHFEFIGFDACLMANLEIAKTLEPFANYLLASEEIEPSSGWDYTSIISTLSKTPTMNGNAIGQLVADSYLAQASKEQMNHGITFSVIKLSEISEITKNLELLLSEVVPTFEVTNNFYNFAKAAGKSRSFGGNSESQGYTDLIDLGDFIGHLSEGHSERTTALLSAIDNAVVYKIDDASSKKTSGLSIYFPLRDKSRYNTKMELYKKIDFSKDYLTFLSQFNRKLSELSGDGTIPYKLKPPNSKTDFYHIDFTEEDSEKISEVYLSVYTLDSDDGDANHSYVKLGYDQLTFYDEKHHFYNELFDKQWLFFDTEPLYVLQKVGNNDREYVSPVLYNGERMNLLYGYVADKTTDTSVDYSNTIQIYGLRRRIDPTTGKPDKELYQLRASDTITPLYKAYNDRRKKFEWIEGTQITITETSKISKNDLVAEQYYLAFKFYDFSYKGYSAGPFLFERY